MLSIRDALILISKEMQNPNAAERVRRLLGNVHQMLIETTPENTPHTDYYSNWSFYFQAQMAIQGQLKLPQEAAAREMVGLLGIGKVSPSVLYSNDNVALRIELRRAYTEVAKAELRAARLDSAISNIEAAFSIKSGPGEYDDPFAGSYETRAMVFREAERQNTKEFEGEYLRSLATLQSKIERGEIKLLDQSLAEDLNSDRFRASRAEDPIERLKRGPEAETWKQALERIEVLSQRLALKPNDWESDREEERSDVVAVLKQESEECVQAAEDRANVSIPLPLRECLMKHGPFRVNEEADWGSFRIYSSEKYDTASIISGLVDAIDDLWGGRPEFKKSFSEDEIQFLNDNYFCFGHYKIDDNAFTHLFFDRSGNFGDLYYHQDDWGDAKRLFRGLLQTSSANSTLDAEIVFCVNEVIDRLIETKEEQEYEY
jgi:hypothetical protein